MTIRQMIQTDVNSIAQIEKKCFSSPWSIEGIRTELSNEHAFFVVAEDEDIVIGYAGMHFVCDEGCVANLAVLDEFRRRGVGRALLGVLLDFSCREGLLFLSLEVRQSNKAAISLYKAHKFDVVGIRKNFYTHPNEDAFIMERSFGGDLNEKGK